MMGFSPIFSLSHKYVSHYNYEMHLLRKRFHYTPPRQSGSERGLAKIVVSVALFPVWFPLWIFAVFLAAQFERTQALSRKLHARIHHYRHGGFTLIELSIVLVVIGLIVGGVLAGQSLISAAAVRAQITQIERFNSAANTFFGKYGYLPGDIPAAPAAQFGFVARGTSPGQGDGNGSITYPHACFTTSDIQTPLSVGEGVVFWTDLTVAGLIAEGLTSASETVATTYWSNTMSQILPLAKLGNGNYVYVFSGGAYNPNNACRSLDSYNYFGIATVSYLSYNNFMGSAGLTVAQAAAIDKKIDDGMPQTGAVVALVANAWSAGGGFTTAGSYWTGTSGASPGTAAPPSATTCYDNGGNAANQMAYSVTQSNGNGVNCALSFRMQAGD
jgi:prepilin-type N-terminal cleavage/methylation domain-containing protein